MLDLNNSQKQPLVVKEVTSLESLKADDVTALLTLYQAVFSVAPYFERYSDAEVRETFDRLIQDGNLVFGVLGEDVATLAGGYSRDGTSYFVDELAVRPDLQGNGYGRATLRALLSVCASFQKLDIRTNIGNQRAIRLYESEGFVRSGVTEVVPHRRSDGSVSLDERVYLTRSSTSQPVDDLSFLRRVVAAYPSGNATALVLDQQLDADRKDLNARLIAALDRSVSQASLEIEQCGFVTLPADPSAVGRVEMFGHEFCGNATRSAIWLITGGADYSGLIETSGVDRLLRFEVADGRVELEMPVPSDTSVVAEMPESKELLVSLEGISHVVVIDNPSVSARDHLTEILDENRADLTAMPAVGVSTYDTNTGKAAFAVWVKAVDTIFDETACGSGTSAIGIAQAFRARSSARLSVIQPSEHVIDTLAAYDAATGSVVSSAIDGPVSIFYDGAVQL